MVSSIVRSFRLSCWVRPARAGRHPPGYLDIVGAVWDKTQTALALRFFEHYPHRSFAGVDQ